MGISMTDATAAGQLANGGIEAELVWTAANHPPEVTLSFDGLNEPTGLFADLQTLGWNVPPVPPRPRPIPPGILSRRRAQRQLPPPLSMGRHASSLSTQPEAK